MFLPHRHVREERVVLEHHAEAALLRPAARRCACRRARCAPPVSGSSPARQLSAVDLPQPEGPSRAMNSPRRIVRSRRSRAIAAPKRRVTPSRRSSPKPSRHYFFTLAPPISSSHFLKAATWPLASSGVSSGAPGDQLLVLRPAELLDRVLALLRRHRERHVLHRRAGIEIALVVGVGLRSGVSR